ncbi:MAG: hypothetical protein A2046_14625 [Bacteroidetes bacterium GWA2_30_7]|nr:MAG: hypothetical protein A2046_14625 [Bacteroidetes bacterium GWA2_30_7]
MINNELRQEVAGEISTKHGVFNIEVYSCGNEEAIVLSFGSIEHTSNGVLCRIQSECIEHFFFCINCDCMVEIDSSLEMIINAKAGLLIYLRQEGKGCGLIERIKGTQIDVRDYKIVAKIINHHQISFIKLISNNHFKEKALIESGIKVEMISPFGNLVLLGEKMKSLVEGIKNKNVSPLISRNELKRILVIGDLNVDEIVDSGADIYGQNKPINGKTKIGGTGYNAAIAFKDEQFYPIVFGNVGNDVYSEEIKRELKNSGFHSFIGTSNKPTGRCTLVYYENHHRSLFYNKDNANDYDINNLNQTLALADINDKDVVFLTSYLFTAKKYDLDGCKKIIDTLFDTGAKIVLDVVPHDIYNKITVHQFVSCFKSQLYAVIGEFQTFMWFIHKNDGTIPYEPKTKNLKEIIKQFNSKYVICRYGGDGHIEKESIYYENEEDLEYICNDTSTGYEKLESDKKRGFGDRLAAKALIKIFKEENKQKILN